MVPTALIVGASLAGARCAESLRRRGWDGRIVLLGAEDERPYDRPPLTKAYLDPDRRPDVPFLLTDAALAALDVELWVGTRATGVNPAARQVTVNGQRQLSYDVLVIATGASPRTWPPGERLAGVHVLRTLGDATALRADLERQPRVAVLGGGFIGAELATAARRRGLDVTVVEMAEAPLARALGVSVGRLVQHLHTAAGVRLRCGVVATDIRGTKRVEQILLSDGSSVEADVLIIALGVTPATSWLRGSGLQIDDGVVCDARLRAFGHDNIYAIGDVARWPHPLLGQSVRIEHWTNAVEHADVAAAGIVGVDKTVDSVPYVWSDQQGRKLQMLGRPRAGDDVAIRADDIGGRHVAIYSRADQLSGVFAIDSPRFIAMARQVIARRGSAKDLPALA